MLLASPVPSPGPPGPFGTMAWLRATVSRFANGAVHARRRALAEALLAPLDPSELRGAARAAAHATVTREASAGGVSRGAAGRASVEFHNQGLCQSTLAYVPLAVLAEALGGERGIVEDVRVVAAAYHPGTDAPGADEALRRVLAALPAGESEPELAAQRVALLVQACEATAALVRGALERPFEDVLRETPPVPATKRLSHDGEVVRVPLDGMPFGAGPRRCPGEAHARALAAGVIEGVR